MRVSFILVVTLICIQSCNYDQFAECDDLSPEWDKVEEIWLFDSVLAIKKPVEWKIEEFESEGNYIVCQNRDSIDDVLVLNILELGKSSERELNRQGEELVDSLRNAPEVDLIYSSESIIDNKFSYYIVTSKYEKAVGLNEYFMSTFILTNSILYSVSGIFYSESFDDPRYCEYLHFLKEVKIKLIGNVI